MLRNLAYHAIWHVAQLICAYAIKVDDWELYEITGNLQERCDVAIWEYRNHA